MCLPRRAFGTRYCACPFGGIRRYKHAWYGDQTAGGGGLIGGGGRNEEDIVLPTTFQTYLQIIIILLYIYISINILLTLLSDKIIYGYLY